MFTAGPLSDPQPPSTLLPAGATTVELTLKAAAPTVCRYSVGQGPALRPDDPVRYQRATRAHPAPSSAGSTPIPAASTTSSSAPPPRPAPRSTCSTAACPRPSPASRARPTCGVPGTSSPKGMEYASRIDLWLGAHFSADQIRQLRRLNPNCLVLTDINTVENNDVPDDYFLRDTTGRKIEVWPGAFRLNLTRPEVAEYQARYAYQRMLESGLMYDGCFFDNFMMSQSWQVHDIYDRPGPARRRRRRQARRPEGRFDKAWREGVFHELHDLAQADALGAHHRPQPGLSAARDRRDLQRPGHRLLHHRRDRGEAALPRALGLLQRLVHGHGQAGDHLGRVGRARSDRLRLRLQPPAAYAGLDLEVRPRLLSLHAVRAGLHA